MQRVLCIGETTVDLIAFPVEKVELNTDYHYLESFLIKAGGDAHNNAVDMARLGNRVTYVGPFGDDIFADNCLESLKKEKVDISNIIRYPGVKQSKSLILLNSEGKRTFYQNFASSEAFESADINTAMLDDADILQIAGTFHMKKFDGEGAAVILKKAKEKGVITSMDVTTDRTGRWGEIIECNYPYLDYFLPSIEQAVHLTHKERVSDMAEYFIEKGVGHVVIKAGETGAYYKDKNTAFMCGCYKVPVKDTTGAGDAFVSGFLTTLGQNTDAVDKMIFATACSAQVIQQVGACEGIESFDQISDYIRQNPLPEIKED